MDPNPVATVEQGFKLRHAPQWVAFHSFCKQQRGEWPEMLRTKCAGLLRAIRQGGALGSAAAELRSSKV